MISPNEAAELTRELNEVAKNIAHDCVTSHRGLSDPPYSLSSPFHEFYGIIETGMREFIEKRILVKVESLEAEVEKARRVLKEISDECNQGIGWTRGKIQND